LICWISTWAGVTLRRSDDGRPWGHWKASGGPSGPHRLTGALDARHQDSDNSASASGLHGPVIPAALRVVEALCRPVLEELLAEFLTSLVQPRNDCPSDVLDGRLRYAVVAEDGLEAQDLCTAP
jgi:hypothetical protein